ncbi:MAG: ABC transporter ATP-binding protein [Chloroflexota bacterium]|jgi:putative ABC transport system ATP-binding protein
MFENKKNVAVTELHENKQSEAFIRLRNVGKTYTSGAGDFTALKGISLDINSGEFIGILGKSGAGKTTFLNMLSGVDHITSGEVWIGDKCIHRMSETRRAKWRGQNLGIIIQSFQLLPSLSLLNNIMLPIDLGGMYHARKSPERAIDLLCQMDIEAHADKLSSQISGGQQQRVAIARALANDPPLILADEPTGSLDSATAETIMRVFDALVKRGKTIIMATHDFSLARYFTRTIEIADGEIVN